MNQSLCAFSVRDENVCSLDGIRLMVLAAARDQETAPSGESQAGHIGLSQDTARCLAGLNSTLASIEGELVGVADSTFDGYEDEGAQNRDVRLAKASAEDLEEVHTPEVLQTRMVPVADVAADIAGWKQALVDEATSLIAEHRACKPVTEEAMRRLEDSPDFGVVRVQENCCQC